MKAALQSRSITLPFQNTEWKDLKVEGWFLRQGCKFICSSQQQRVTSQIFPILNAAFICFKQQLIPSRTPQKIIPTARSNWPAVSQLDHLHSLFPTKRWKSLSLQGNLDQGQNIHPAHFISSGTKRPVCCNKTAPSPRNELQRNRLNLYLLAEKRWSLESCV